MRPGFWEIVIIIVAIFLFFVVFGPKNLPKLGSAVGKAVKNLRDGLGGSKKVKEAKDEEVEEAEVVEDAPKPSKPKPQSLKSAEDQVEVQGEASEAAPQSTKDE